MTQSPSRLWTVDEYHRMAETGILGAEERRAYRRHIVPKSPKKPPHSAVTQRAANYLRETLTELAYIRVQELFT